MQLYKRARLIILPGLLGFIVFYVLPFFWSFSYALTNNSFQRKFIWVDNFIQSFKNEYYILALKNTLSFTVVGVCLIVAFSLLISILVVTAGSNYTFLRMAFVLPMLLPTAGIALVWRVVFNPSDILLTKQSILPGFLGVILNPQIIPVYLLFIWKYCGFNIILLISALSGISRETYEAASLDGAHGWRLHFDITIPLIRPTLFFAIVLSLVNSFRIFKEIYYLFASSYPPDSVYFVQYYMNNHFAKLNYQVLSSGAIIFSLIVFFIVWIGYRTDNYLDKN